MIEPIITTTEHVKVTAVKHDNLLTISVVEKESDRTMFSSTLPIAGEADYAASKVLTIAWLAIGMMTPISDRLENLSEHGLSRASFFVTADAILIAKAYRELTNGGDITEAI